MTIEQGEIRQERASLAASAARSNLPSSVFVLALGLFVVAFVALVWCMFARQNAASLLEARVAQAEAIFRSVDEIKSMRAQIARAKDTRSNEPIYDVPLRLQNAAPNQRLLAALQSTPARESPLSKDQGVAQKKFTITGIQHESIDDLMAWIDKSLADIKGLEVESIDLTPSANNWSLTITFSRWEKKEG
ncbi:MAG: hypothetical protein AABZ53_04295 [Planctomycetota bacterium]